MAHYSLNSYRKSLRFLLFFFLIASVFIAGIDISLTSVLNKRLQAIEGLVANSGDRKISFKRAYFNFFSGLVVTGIAFDSKHIRVFEARRLDIGFDLLSLFQRKIRIKNISVKKSNLDLPKFSELSFLLGELFKNRNDAIGFFETTYFRGTDVWLNKAAQADLRGYVSFINGRLLISRGELLFKKIVPAFVGGSDILEGSSIYKSFDYVFEAEPQGEDFYISRFELSNPHLKCAGSGRIEHYLKAPFMQFEMSVLNLVFDDFPILNTGHVKAQGVVEATLKVMGPLADLKTLLEARVTNAQFSFFDSVFFKNINGSFLFFNNHLTGQKIRLDINGVPFSTDVAIYERQGPHLLLSLSSLPGATEMPSLALDLSADWIRGELVGGIKTLIRYTSQGPASTIELNLKDFHLGYEDDLYLNIRHTGAGLTISSSKTKVFKRDLNIENLFCIFRKEEDGFSLSEVRADCYDGTLDGELHFITANDPPVLKGEAHLRGVDLEQFFGPPHKDSYTLSGNLDADLRMDSSLVDMFKGQVFITNGIVEQNPLLNSVANFLGVASLKKIAFSDVSMFFNGGRGEYTSQVKLVAPLVNGFMDGRISSYDKMDGYLSVTMATTLLNESQQFKKILAYIKHGEPVVIFPFKISSYIDSPRVLWLKNEFKEKLQKLLPESNKRFLQGQVTNMIGNMKEE